MPTENRSSNTDMVSVPREPTREMLAAAHEVNGIFPTWRAMVAAAPADQRQGEYPPCDYCGTVPDYHPWHGSGMIRGVESKHIHACDGCRSKLPPHPESHQVEPAAWYDPHHQDFLTAEGRAATLRMGDGDRLARYSVRLFAAPTAAEELDSVRHWRGKYAEVMRERDTLRALMAERDALLRECQSALDKAGYGTWQIDDLLSASAEPSKIGNPELSASTAPAASIPEGYCLMPRRLTAENGAKALLLGEFKLNVVRECPECHDLEEPVEGCEICDGEGEYAQHHTIPWNQIKFIYSEAVKGLAIQPDTVRELRSVGATDGQA